jgi:quercetin dioxygenase-like cupin family protein
VEDLYPPIIRDLPQADIPFPGIKGWLLRGIERQVVFFDIEPTAVIPEHAHGEQWGVVLEGEVEMTISGVRRLYRRGDAYYIPAGAPHSATFRGRFKAVDLFAEADRYQPLPSPS